MTTLALAVALSLLIGLSLGLLGGGGSILTVPILIYALGVEEKSAIASSLLVVGATSAVAVIQHARRGNVVWRVALIFAGAGMVGAFLGGKFAALLPASVLLVLFAVIMFGTALAMWKGRKPSTLKANPAPTTLPVPTILLEGVVVGVVTGLVGAGGGFLVVPALALLGGLPMAHAVGSSLVVIALKSFAGFAGYVSHVEVDYKLTAIVTAAAIAGSFIGAALGKRVQQEQLRKGFAVFVFVMAVFLLVKQGQAYLAKHEADAPTPTASAAPVATQAGPALPALTVDLSRIPSGPEGERIRRGKLLAEKTHERLPDNVGNSLACTNCHLGAGTTPGAAAWVGVTSRYPQYRARSGKVDTLAERVNDCFERSMNGIALDEGSTAMGDLLAWMEFLSTGEGPAGDGTGDDGRAVAEAARIHPLVLTRAPDSDRGAAVFSARCAACHGADGTGLKGAEGMNVFPAVAGAGSFNVGAGMARLHTAAGFIKSNMPLGQGGTLSDDEAWDVAGYVTALARPDYALKGNDWPRGGKPTDARY